MYIPSLRKRCNSGGKTTRRPAEQYNCVAADPADVDDRRRYVALYEASATPMAVTMFDVEPMRKRFDSLLDQVRSETEWTGTRLEAFAAAHVTVQHYNTAAALLNKEADRIATKPPHAAVSELYNIVMRIGATPTEVKFMRRLLAFTIVPQHSSMDGRDLKALRLALHPYSNPDDQDDQGHQDDRDDRDVRDDQDDQDDQDEPLRKKTRTE